MFKIFHLIFLYIHFHVVNLGVFICYTLENGQVLTSISFQKKPEVTVCAGHRPLKVTVPISMTWHSKIRLTRKYISFQFSLLVKFLLEFNIFTRNLPKLLAGKGVHSGARRKTLELLQIFHGEDRPFLPEKDHLLCL